MTPGAGDIQSIKSSGGCWSCAIPGPSVVQNRQFGADQVGSDFFASADLREVTSDAKLFGVPPDAPQEPHLAKVRVCRIRFGGAETPCPCRGYSLCGADWFEAILDWFKAAYPVEPRFMGTECRVGELYYLGAFQPLGARCLLGVTARVHVYVCMYVLSSIQKYTNDVNIVTR